MPEQPMIAWTMARSDGEGAAPDIAVYPDGRMVLAPRFGGGERRLSQSELEALRRFVFEDQQVLEIDPASVETTVRSADATRARHADPGALEIAPRSAMDAGTTVIRANDGGRSREIRHYDLAGAAQAYPDVDPLQRLRAVELRLLELAERP